jgi:hypothetical protein
VTRRAASRRTVGPRFDVVDRFPPFDLLPPRFVAVRDELGPTEGMVRSAWSPPAPFVTVEVTTSDADGVAFAGLSAENGDHLLGFHDTGTGEVGIELRTGKVTTVLARKRVRRRVRRIAFVLCENQPTVLVDSGRGWRPVLAVRNRVAMSIDFRVPTTLARFTATWGLRGGTSDVGLARAGLFGMAGLRDLHLVQHADGTPYVADGRMYLTATCAGLGFFQQAHWGVFAFGPARLSTGGGGERWVLEKTAHLFSRRDGMLFGDHAGQVVRDGDRWLVAVSSWGDFAPHKGVYVRHGSTIEDVLHGVHVLDTERVSMPTDRGSYDPGMTRIDGRWHVSYVESVSHDPSRFHPALAVGPEGAADWTEGLERVGEASDLDFCEGPVLARPDGPQGEWRLLASDGRARRYCAFDLAMRPVGDLDAPYGTNLPHPQVFDLPDGERVMVTFDGTPYAKRMLGYGTHGDVVVMQAAPPCS